MTETRRIGYSTTLLLQMYCVYDGSKTADSTLQSEEQKVSCQNSNSLTKFSAEKKKIIQEKDGTSHCQSLLYMYEIDKSSVSCCGWV